MQIPIVGIQGALKHDIIMDPSKHDYLIVEAEAERVATEAVKALKRSRSQCLGPMAGVPNWTGHHGSMVKKYVYKISKILIYALMKRF